MHLSVCHSARKSSLELAARSLNAEMTPTLKASRLLSILTLPRRHNCKRMTQRRMLFLARFFLAS